MGMSGSPQYSCKIFSVPKVFSTTYSGTRFSRRSLVSLWTRWSDHTLLSRWTSGTTISTESTRTILTSGTSGSRGPNNTLKE